MDELAGSLSSPQLTEWLAYERLEPFAADRIDLNAAFDRWRNHRQNGGTSERPGDFRLTYGAPPKVETSAAKLARIKAGLSTLSSSRKQQGK